MTTKYRKEPKKVSCNHHKHSQVYLVYRTGDNNCDYSCDCHQCTSCFKNGNQRNQVNSNHHHHQQLTCVIGSSHEAERCFIEQIVDLGAPQAAQSAWRSGRAGEKVRRWIPVLSGSHNERAQRGRQLQPRRRLQQQHRSSRNWSFSFNGFRRLCVVGIRQNPVVVGGGGGCRLLQARLLWWISIVVVVVVVMVVVTAANPCSWGDNLLETAEG